MDSVDVEADLDCVQEGALLAPFALRVLVVTGKDRIAWLNGLVTCDLARARVGDGAYGLLVQRNGKLLAELHLVLADDRILVALPSDRAEALVEHLDRHLIMEDVELRLDDAMAAGVAFGLRADELVEAASRQGGVAGVFRRNGVPAAVIFAGQGEKGPLAVVREVSPSAAASPPGWNRVRVEHGITAWGVDFDENNYPQEAALEKDAVSFDKGCYLGQETVFMLEKRGHVSKRVVQMVLASDVPVGARIVDEAKKDVGFVTSFASRPGPRLALGWVKYKLARVDAEVWIGDARATVTALLAITSET